MKTEGTAQLILENGARFTGRAFGHVHDAAGEVIFTTGVTGYLEEITDPAHCGQIVVMTYPLIGNCGVNAADMESEKAHLSALVVREICDAPNNFRSETDLNSFLQQQGVMGLAGIDTRALTRLIRDNGCMRGLITTRPDAGTVPGRTPDEAEADAALVRAVSTKAPYEIPGTGAHLAVLDLGITASLLGAFRRRGCRLTVFPCDTAAADIAAAAPDALLVSGGPGDPHALTAVETIRALAADLPILGVGNGHLAVALALGCTVARMRFGHHGANHPAKNCRTGTVSVVAQNHRFAVTAVPDTVAVTYVNVNDGSCEGIRHKTLPVCGVQFLPETSDLPEMAGLFDTFLAGGKHHA